MSGEGGGERANRRGRQLESWASSRKKPRFPASRVVAVEVLLFVVHRNVSAAEGAVTANADPRKRSIVANKSIIPEILQKHEGEILEEWISNLKGGRGRTGRLKEGELETQARDVLGALRTATEGGVDNDVSSQRYSALHEILGAISRARALQSFTPSETATFVLSLKEPIFNRLGKSISDVASLRREVWSLTVLIDQLALYTTDAFQQMREEVIKRQQQELTELSTPVVRLWKGVLALPLIGTLDSERTQVVMENLLKSLVDTGAEIAIIDITGVPTVDTQVAQHLLKTVAAARLMGADCIISGIRPQIAQTMVHLGVELNVVSKATLADAFAIALDRLGKAVVSTKPRG
jgi:rsbT co-antagonist protein RsbR